MARIRSIKPEFFTSLTMADVGVHVRLTFIGLWTHVDDEGRCLNEPRLMKAALWPLDDDVTADDVRRFVNELAKHGLVVMYSHEGREYLEITSWDEHQSISKPRPSRLPSPTAPGSVLLGANHTDGGLPEVSDPPPGTLPDDSSRERKGTGNREQGYVADDGDEPIPAFDEFWAAYPRHHQTGKIAGGGSKHPAEARWKKLKPDEKRACMVAVANYAKAMAATGEWVKHPEGWLTERRWQDWLDPGPLRTPGGRDDSLQVIV